MKTIFILTFVLAISGNLYAQNQTYLNVIQSLASKQNLDVSYSPELVNLSEETDFSFSENTEICLAQLEKQAGIRISKTESHLIITPAPPTLIEIRGTVTDANSGETLPYAHLLLKKAGTGTITNSKGIFSFKILGRFAGDEITFSFLGYENTTFLIPFLNTDSINIKMTPKPYNLADVYVLPNGNEAIDIVKRAVKNIKRNYDRNTHQMEAFYRNTNYRDTTATQLIDAALLIEDKGIMHPTSTTKIELEEIRKSTNYQVPMDKKHKAAIKIMEGYFGGHRNTFYRSYGNYVRIYRDDWWYQPLTDYETFKYEFEGFEWMDSIKVYKIRFTYDALWLDGRRASESKNSDDGGFIYINSEDWAILKMEHWWKVISENNLRNFTIKENYISKNEMGYQKINGKYYLKYTSGFASPNGTSFVYKNPDAPDKEKVIKERQYAETTLLVTKVITDKKEMDRIRYREKLAKDENSYETQYPYNPEFWNNYNILKENPVEERFIREMEWEKSMDVQFEENSSNVENN